MNGSSTPSSGSTATRNTAVSAVLMAEIQNCANTTRRKASLSRVARSARQRASGAEPWRELAASSDSSAPITMPSRMCASARPKPVPATWKNSAFSFSQVTTAARNASAFAGRYSNSHGGRLARESSTISAMRCTSTGMLSPLWRSTELRLTAASAISAITTVAISVTATRRAPSWPNTGRRSSGTSMCTSA